MNSKTTPSKTPKLPIFVGEAVSEQQDRVWRLRNLIQCLREVGHDQIEDHEAALSGLVDYADEIHLALDIGALAARAAELRAESNER